MPSILFTVFILQLVIHIVNTIGASTINNLLWSLYINFASPKAAAEQRELKAQFMRVRTEMNATSSQDEFAKWAKLRRQHDKLLEQLEKNKASSDAAKSTFDTTASSLRWVCTNGFRMYIQYSYMKQPMFWVPKGWVPYYAEWLLSFPRSPLGSVSVNVWVLACAAVITLAHDFLVAVVALVGNSGNAQVTKGTPIKVSDKTQAAGGGGVRRSHN